MCLRSGQELTSVAVGAAEEIKPGVMTLTFAQSQRSSHLIYPKSLYCFFCLLLEIESDWTLLHVPFFLGLFGLFLFMCILCA